MFLRRRSPLLIAATIALVALMTAGVIVRRHGASSSHEASGGATPRPEGTSDVAAPGIPNEGLLAAQNLEYAPDLDPFDVASFLHSIGSDLTNYVVERGDERVGFGELVADAAERHAVNPRVLLILMELASGVVSAPSPDLVMRAAGYPPEVASDVEAQIERLAATLSSHYVAAFMGDEPMVVHGPGGDPVRLAAEDPAPAAIARTLAETLPFAELGAAVSGPRPEFHELYRQWFGDPLAIPVFAQGVTLPGDAVWPFEGTRRHTGGPHLGSFCSQQDILAASGLDFGGESHEVLAMADGRYLGRGETTAPGYQAGKYVLLEHEGGVQVMYWHLAGFTPEVQALAPGAEIPRGFPVGWSGRSGNQSAVHLHVELRRGAVATNPYSGVRVAWDGQVVDGWTVRMFRWPGRTDRGVSYRGTAVRGEARVLAIGNCACDQTIADVIVSTQHPGTSTPRNGMDVYTVFANYPDVGLLPSSNTRTTALWSTVERGWRNRLPWYYLVDGRDGIVDEVRLDGQLLFTAPECARAIWLGAGEHRLAWRYREDGGAGGPALRIVPWPFGIPACAGASSDAPPDHVTPPASPYDDAAPATGSATGAEATGEVGSVVTVTWRLRNTGTLPWGDGYRLTYDDGWVLDAAEGAPLPAVAPGHDVTVTLPITVPSGGGVAHAVWRLRGPDGVAFGPALTAAIGALSATSDTTPAAPRQASAPAAPELLEPVSDEGETVYLARREVTLRWANAGEAMGYVLHVSLSASPVDDPNPVYREQLDAAVRERRLVFAVDVPRLYWQVTALTAQGDITSGTSAFGLDTEAPICSAAIASSGDGRGRVTWQGEDALSGPVSYEVAYGKDGDDAWRPLLTGGSADVLEAPLAAPRGGTYAVRCRARDAAGNVGPWSEGAKALLGEGARAQVAGSGLVVTALPANRLFVAAPVRNVGVEPGDALLSLVLESGLGSPLTVHRWDVARLAPGVPVTLTAMITGPTGVGAVGEPLDAGYRLTVQSRDGAGAELAAMVDVCLARSDAYEAWDASDDGAPRGASLRPGWRQTRGFHAPWDVDHARVVAEQGRTYVLWTEDVGPDVATVMELYDVAGDLVGYREGIGGPGSPIVWIAPTDGVYLVAIRPWAPGSEGCGAGYTLRLQTEPAAPEVPETAADADGVRLPLIVRPGSP